MSLYHVAHDWLPGVRRGKPDNIDDGNVLMATMPRRQPLATLIVMMVLMVVVVMMTIYSGDG